MMVSNGRMERRVTTILAAVTVNNDAQGRAPSGTTACDSSGDSTPPASQNNSYFENFKNGPGFWEDASAKLDSNQPDTPPTSSSSAVSTNSSSRPYTTSSDNGTSGSKRKASQVSTGPCEDPRPVKKPRESPEDSDESIINLSPTYQIQHLINTRQLPYSVQWELARLVSKGLLNWEGSGDRVVTVAALNFLQHKGETRNRQSEGARKVQEYFTSERADAQFTSRSENERMATDPWGELDREEALAMTMTECDHLDEKGGKVHFIATLKQVSDRQKRPTTANYKVELNQAELGPSCSFSRRFGSKCFLRLKIPTALIHSGLNLVEFLCKPIVLCQGVYRAFYAKEQTAFYFRTNEEWKPDANKILPPSSTSSGLGLKQFLDWHNSIEANKGQTMAKWASRFALGLSTSIHGITLEENDITIIDDIKSNQGADMTDGAGFITRSLLQKLVYIHDWPTRPSAIQVRVRGSKGLLIEHPTIDTDNLSIQLRPSLVKIQYPGPLDKTQRSVDILRTSHARAPTRISVDVIINLHENGVPFDALCQLVEKTVDSVIQPLLKWDMNDRTILKELWLNFERSGSVIKSRRAREEVAFARVDGHTEHDTTEEVQEDDEDAKMLDTIESSVEWWPDDISGLPSSLEETIMAFLDSGFHPSSCPILREKIFSVVTKTLSRAIENCTIDIPFSASAWIVPDPTGILAPHQLFFKNSQPNLVSLDGTETDIVTGDVLITRDPCRLPTDVQKWTAVDVSQLHYLKDVIVLSVQGPRRAADWLAGGDYDGDKAKIIWQPELVKDFRNADEHFASPPPDLDSFFEINNERVVDFLHRVQSIPHEQQLREIQKYLLGTMKDYGMVGRYSMFHEYSTYVNGYAHPTTKLLAYLFTTVLDGRKTGKTIRGDIYKQHDQQFGIRKINWKETLRKRAEGELAPSSNVKPLYKGSFVMEKLVNFGKQLEKKRLADLAQKKLSFNSERDAQLLEPMLEVEAMIRKNIEEGNIPAADALKSDYGLIKSHVEKAYAEHRREMRQALQSSSKQPGVGFTNLPIQKRQDTLRKLSQNFHSEPPRSKFAVMAGTMSDRIKASYAYYYDYEKSPHPTRFAWDVAFRVLCCIKTGNEVKPVHKQFYDYMVIKLPKRRKHYV